MSHDEPFVLQPPKRERKRLQVVETGITRQGKLFSGTDCLPGQGELFNPNGPRERDLENPKK
jgi:hypothetical protein